MTNHCVPLTFLCVFAFLGAAIGQTTTNAPSGGTNQPVQQKVPVVVAPVGPEVTPPEPPMAIDDSINTNEVQELTNETTSAIVTPPPEQPQIGPVNPGTGTQPIAPIMGTSALAGASQPLGPLPAGPGIPVWGPISIHPLLNYTFLYGKGIESAPGQSSSTVINTISPGFILALGSHWTLEYSPSFSVYSSSAFKNTTDENVFLRGAASNEVWSVNFMQSYVSTSDPLLETGEQTSQDAYATTLSGTHQVSGRSSIELTVNQNFRFESGEGFSDLHEWTTADWFNYQLLPSLTTSIGTTLGYDQLSSGSDMPFEQLLGRVNLQLGAKMLLIVTFGGEDRQFVDPSAKPLISPIFNGTLTYQLFQPTLLSLEASRTVTPSLFANEVETETAITASIRQTLTQKLYFTLSGAYTTLPLTSVVPERFAAPQYFIGQPPPVTYLQQVQDQDSKSVRMEFDYRFSPRLGGSVFYTLGQNSAGTSEYRYTTSQGGLSLSYQF